MNSLIENSNSNNYEVPKIFSDKNSKYFELSIQAKYLYGILREENKLSIKRNLVDEKGRVYFLFAQKDLCKAMGVKDPKTIRKYIKELENVSLLYREKQSVTEADRIYLLKLEDI